MRKPFEKGVRSGIARMLGLSPRHIDMQHNSRGTGGQANPRPLEPPQRPGEGTVKVGRESTSLTKMISSIGYEENGIIVLTVTHCYPYNHTNKDSLDKTIALSPFSSSTPLLDYLNCHIRDANLDSLLITTHTLHCNPITTFTHCIAISIPPHQPCHNTTKPRTRCLPLHSTGSSIQSAGR